MFSCVVVEWPASWEDPLRCGGSSYLVVLVVADEAPRLRFLGRGCRFAASPFYAWV